MKSPNDDESPKWGWDCQPWLGWILSLSIPDNVSAARPLSLHQKQRASDAHPTGASERASSLGEIPPTGSENQTLVWGTARWDKSKGWPNLGSPQSFGRQLACRVVTEMPRSCYYYSSWSSQPWHLRYKGPLDSSECKVELGGSSKPLSNETIGRPLSGSSHKQLSFFTSNQLLSVSQ